MRFWSAWGVLTVAACADVVPAPADTVLDAATVREDAGRELSCQERADSAAISLIEAEAEADKSCTMDDDCVLADGRASCYFPCQGSAVSQQGRAAIDSVLETIENGICASFLADGCHVDPPPCPAASGVRCNGGTCEASFAGMPECRNCFDHELIFGPSGPGSLEPTFRISGCDSFTVEGPAGVMCSTTLPGCGASGHIVEELLRAVMSADVIEAARDHALLGGAPTSPPDDADHITLDGETFSIAHCGGLESGCELLPAGVSNLLTLLDALRIQQSCDPSECELPFDEGTGGEDVQVYWHDPDSRACVGRSYGGSGGNANRFDSAQSCEANCPPPTKPEDCPTARLLAGSACLECDPAGGCGRSAPMCVLACEDDADCADEATVFGMSECQGDGVCILSGCL